MTSTETTHNILVTGGERNDRITYAKCFAKCLLCINRHENAPCHGCKNCERIDVNTHPNVVIIEPQDSEDSDKISSNQSKNSALIKIDQIRRVLAEHQKTNFEKGVSIFIITQMNNITIAAANALLKAFEESNRGKIFIALAPSRMSVLPTIASRLICHLVKPSLINNVVPTHERERIMRISKTNPSSRFPLCGQFSSERDELLNDLTALTIACHNLLRHHAILPHFAFSLLEALNKAEKNLRKNQNPRLVAEILVLREWPFMT